MKILKYLFLIVLIAVIGALIYVATINGHFRVEKGITINAPQELVFNEVNNLKNWKKWAFSTTQNKNLSFSYPERTMGKNAHISWKSDSLRNGSLSTKTLVHDSSLNQKTTLESRFGDRDYNISWNFEKQNDSTAITVQVKGKLGFWSKAHQVFQDSTVSERLSPKVEKILLRLKKQILKKMEAFSVNIDGVSQTEPKNYIYTSQASKNKPQVMARKRQMALGKLHAFLSKNKLTQNGPPFMLFNTIDQQHDNVIVSICIPVDGKAELDENSSILFGTLPRQRALKSTLKGNYENAPKLWEAAKTYMQMNGLEKMKAAKPYEVFVRDVERSKNPADWITQLYVPLQSQQEKENNQLGF